MRAQLWKHNLSLAFKAARPVVRAALYGVRVGLTTAWSVVRPILRLAFEVTLALIILFEEWGWRPLAALLARAAHVKPIAVIEAWITHLPPYAALCVFALPTLFLLPLKLLALFLIATGHKVMAALLFLGAKVFGTAIVARLFHLTHDQLMQIAWFKAAYNRVMPWKDALVDRVRQSGVWKQGRVLKNSLKLRCEPIVRRLKQRVGHVLNRWH
jgi:hypothetical protein